jgi:hypothetical protein
MMIYGTLLFTEQVRKKYLEEEQAQNMNILDYTRGSISFKTLIILEIMECIDGIFMTLYGLKKNKMDN